MILINGWGEILLKAKVEYLFDSQNHWTFDNYINILNQNLGKFVDLNPVWTFPNKEGLWKLLKFLKRRMLTMLLPKHSRLHGYLK